MQVIQTRNVQQALLEGCYRMRAHGVVRESRNGPVKYFPGVTVTEYQRPDERVLLSPIRNANPFFHFFESLWMLRGDRDVAYPSQFNAGMKKYSDDGHVFNAAYGFRWRKHFGKDQLEDIAQALRDNPECRRQVLAIWDGFGDLGKDTKDQPCNLTVTFQVNEEGELDMVVFNRSNDLIWGAYGANAVHFSYLLEYMAAKIGVKLGKYTQVSSNTHIYEPHWPLMQAHADMAPMPPSRYRDSYSLGDIKPFKMVNTPIGDWERELDSFFKDPMAQDYVDPFFAQVANPLFRAWKIFSMKEDHRRYTGSIMAAKQCQATDWARACSEWIVRREYASTEVSK